MSGVVRGVGAHHPAARPAPRYARPGKVISTAYLLCVCSFPDPKGLYKILGLQQLCQNATVQDIKLAFRKLAIPHHPGLAPAAQAATTAEGGVHFEEILAAYKVLRDPGKREKYDKL